MMVFVNLFFVPCIALAIYYRRQGRELAPTMDLAVSYAIFAACNLPFAHIFVAAARHFLGKNILPDGSKYTLIAIVTAVIMPYIAEFCRKYVKVTLEMKEKKDESDEV